MDCIFSLQKLITKKWSITKSLDTFWSLFLFAWILFLEWGNGSDNFGTFG